nr:hypothetical protein [Psychromonas sp. SP041]
MPTYQFDDFSSAAKNTLFNETYTVPSNIDRMGYRLKAKSIEFVEQSFISKGIGLGAIQISADGQLIVLMRDR